MNGKIFIKQLLANLFCGQKERSTPVLLPVFYYLDVEVDIVSVSLPFVPLSIRNIQISDHWVTGTELNEGIRRGYVMKCIKP